MADGPRVSLLQPARDSQTYHTAAHTYPHDSTVSQQPYEYQDDEMPTDLSRHARATSTSSSASPDLELDHYRHHDDNSSDEEAALNGEDKSARRQQRDGHSSVNGRTVNTNLTSTEAQQIAARNVLQKSVINGILIFLWYLFSVSISVYNKWMFADKELNFQFPLFTTSFHMVVQFVLSFLVLWAFPKLRPRAEVESQRTDDLSNPQKPLMSSWFYFTRIAPCATATGLDIGLGNTSLRFVTLTFFTMCKSSTLGFVLLFAILFRLEKMSWKLAGIIAIMTLGVIMMVYGETAFSALGFILLMMASFFSGLRWSLTQILLKRNPATSNPFASLFFLTPIMFLVLLIIAFPVEGLGPLLAGLSDLADRKGGLLTYIILMMPGVLAFCMTTAEFALLQRTSVVTLSVCGIFKEVLTIGAGGIIFNDLMTPINISGVLVTICAIAAYNYIRVKKMKAKSADEAQKMTEEQAPMLSADPGPEQITQGPEHGRTPSTGDMIARSLRISSEVPGRSRAESLKQSSPATPRSPIIKSPQNLD